MIFRNLHKISAGALNTIKAAAMRLFPGPNQLS